MREGYERLLNLRTVRLPREIAVETTRTSRNTSAGVRASKPILKTANDSALPRGGYVLGSARARSRMPIGSNNRWSSCSRSTTACRRNIHYPPPLTTLSMPSWPDNQGVPASAIGLSGEYRVGCGLAIALDLTLKNAGGPPSAGIRGVANSLISIAWADYFRICGRGPHGNRKDAGLPSQTWGGIHSKAMSLRILGSPTYRRHVGYPLFLTASEGEAVLRRYDSVGSEQDGRSQRTGAIVETPMTVYQSPVSRNDSFFRLYSDWGMGDERVEA